MADVAGTFADAVAEVSNADLLAMMGKVASEQGQRTSAEKLRETLIRNAEEAARAVLQLR